MKKTEKIADQVAGKWKDHPLFKNCTVKEIIEFLRGPDDDVPAKTE